MLCSAGRDPLAVDPGAFAKQVFRMVMGLVHEGQLPRTDVKVMPAFTKRESL